MIAIIGNNMVSSSSWRTNQKRPPVAQRRERHRERVLESLCETQQVHGAP
jgi:hypothetical protein